MAFWWVNHGQSWRAETSRGILWAPLRKSNNAQYEPYSNLKFAEAGDIVFSHADGQIAYVGSVDAAAVLSPKPDYASSKQWADSGLLLPVTFVTLERAITPRHHLDRIADLLPEKYAPIRANGNGNLAYFVAISDQLGRTLLQLGKVEEGSLRSEAMGESVVDDLERLGSDADLKTTDRVQLTKARVGQGLFRKSVLAIEPACRVTGINLVPLLRASHIKPWRESSNAERLDGSNGLMLAPHIDLLFDRFLISFDDDGQLLFSTKLERVVREKWNLADAIAAKPFSDKQKRYMETHRRRLL